MHVGDVAACMNDWTFNAQPLNGINCHIGLIESELWVKDSRGDLKN